MYGGRAQPRWARENGWMLLFWSSTTTSETRIAPEVLQKSSGWWSIFLGFNQTCPVRPLLRFWMQSNKESENRIRQASASLNFPAARELLPLNTLPKWSCPLSTVEHSCHTGGQDVTVPRFYNVMSRIFHALTNKSTNPAPLGILKNITPITPTYGVCNIPAL